MHRSRPRARLRLGRFGAATCRSALCARMTCRGPGRVLCRPGCRAAIARACRALDCANRPHGCPGSSRGSRARWRHACRVPALGQLIPRGQDDGSAMCGSITHARALCDGYFRRLAILVAALVLRCFPVTYVLPLLGGSRSSRLLHHAHGLARFAWMCGCWSGRPAWWRTGGWRARKSGTARRSPCLAPAGPHRNPSTSTRNRPDRST
jgi:hypothetical protein